MGTSKTYGSPKWPGVNDAVGEAVSEGPPTKEKIASAVGAFASAYKGYINFGTTGRSGAVTGGTSAGGRTSGACGLGGGATARTRAAATGARLAGFLSSAAAGGLNQALEDFNLSDLVGRPLEEVLDAILDKLCEDGGLLDDTALTDAMARTFDELAEEVETAEEFDELLSGGAVNIEGYLQIYYANVLAVNFEQKEAGYVRERVPRAQTEKFFLEAKELISAIIQEELSQDRDLTSLDWNSPEGIAIADSINQEVLEILIPNDTY